MCLVQDWLISNAFNEVFGETGLPRSGKKFWKMKKKSRSGKSQGITFSVREI